MHDQYIYSGSLPENASTYVKREADNELYEALLQGQFCYVLNSRQSGKSSLRVRTMSRLNKAGVECASIDFSSISIQSATQENWYADLIVKLIDSFVLDIDFKGWWEQNQLNSPLLRFSNFISKILLKEVQENIVIFIDEIDSVLSLNFPTDDFFAFIRSCYNLRVDNPEYNRLTFCLLGVASPTSLIQDKNRTPFNIGKAIYLKGFQLHEIEPLKKGLHGKFSNPQAVMQEILSWTGGQPFLTQKLCQFMVEESEQDIPHSVEQVMRLRIIENWESQDEPEHLRTIQARIMQSREKRIGRLLGLYQQILRHQEIASDDSSEQTELQLTGLVVKRNSKLRIYNRIYEEVFKQEWCDKILTQLRPYADGFNAWIACERYDESRLLRGKALQNAQTWAVDKSLSDLDYQFLAASQELDKRDVQKRLEAEAQAKQILERASRKASKKIRIGSVALAVEMALIAILGIISYRNTSDLIYSSRVEAHTYQVIAQLDNFMSGLINAETGERGYLLTGEQRYLEPYNAAIGVLNQKLNELHRLTADNPNQQNRLDILQPLLTEKMAVMKDVIELRQSQGLEASQKAVLTDQDKQLMDNIQKVIQAMRNEENALLDLRSQKSRIATIQVTSLVAYYFPLTFLVFIFFLFYFVSCS